MAQGQIDLPQFLKDWRKNMGWTQAKAAAALGMALPTYRGVEQGRPFPHQHLLVLATAHCEENK